MAAARGLISMPRNWCGSTVKPKPSNAACVSPKPFSDVADFAFEPFHVFQGDVQKVPGPARGVEDGRVAELA